MIDFAYLPKGLNALARAHAMGPMAGHLGAAVVAGYLVGEQRPALAPEVAAGIEGDLGRVMGGESVFGKRMSKASKLSDTELFAPLPESAPDPGLIDAIAEALARSLGAPRQSGHNVIFGSLALRALRGHPELCTAPRVDGICKLLRLFEGAHPGSGNYGKARGRIRGDKVELPDSDGTPAYTDIDGMAGAVFDELLAADPTVRRQGYGGLVHVINHAAAIADLALAGYPDLVPRAVASHRQHLRLWRQLPDLSDELGPVKVSAATPHSPEYWTSGEVPYDRALLTHRVKTMFGFDALAAAVEDDGSGREQKAYDRLRTLM